MSRKQYIVSYRQSEDHWRVALPHSARASATASTKAEAIERGRELAKSAPLGQLLIEKKAGGFQKEYTYGQDPRKYKG